MLVQFSTNEEKTYAGFSGSFHYFPIDTNCKDWLNIISRKFKSPDYPSINCSWVISAPTWDSTIIIKFQLFEVEKYITTFFPKI